MKRLWFVLAILILSTGLAACGAGDEAMPAGTADVGDPAAGQRLFNTGGASQVPCASCHTLDGTALVGPSMQGIAELAGERVPGLTAAEYLHQSIVDPSAYVVEGFSDVMNKNYAEKLSEEEINNLIAFLLTQ